MFARLFPVFVIMPILELWLLFQIAGQIGFFATLLLVLTTAAIGVNLLRQQGLNTMLRFQQRIEKAQIPVQEMTEGLMLFLAGGMLLTPGIVTDTLGFLILIPQTRSIAARKLSGLLKDRVQVHTTSGFEYRNSAAENKQQTHRHSSHVNSKGDILEGEYEKVD